MRPSVKFSFLIALLLCQIFVYMASLLTVEGNTCRSSELFVCVCQMPALALLSGRREANYNKSKACHIIAKCGRLQIVQFTFDSCIPLCEIYPPSWDT